MVGRKVGGHPAETNHKAESIFGNEPPNSQVNTNKQRDNTRSLRETRPTDLQRLQIQRLGLLLLRLLGIPAVLLPVPQDGQKLTEAAHDQLPLSISGRQPLSGGRLHRRLLLATRHGRPELQASASSLLLFLMLLLLLLPLRLLRVQSGFLQQDEVALALL